MILNSVELHNIAEVHEVPGRDGLRLQRVPEDVRQQLNERAQERVLSPACAEIRFVTTASKAQLTLSSDGATDVVPFFGPFQSRQRFTITSEPRAITIDVPERLQQVDPALTAGLPFAPQVTRLMLAGGPLYIHQVDDAEMRPPTPEELPALRYLAYGTSITHGGAASGPHLTYVGQTARRLGADLINLGVGGSAYCEAAFADYIAGRDDWDIATLALSVNMVGAHFSLDAFYERVGYMVNAVAGAETSRPVVCITLYPHFREFGPALIDTNALGTPEAYRQRLRDAVAACPHPNVHLIEGTDILQDVSGLTVDLIHPGDNGMIRMGQALAEQLAPLLGHERNHKRGGRAS